MADLLSGGVVGGTVRRYRTVVTLAAQAAGAYALVTLPPGHTFAYGVVTSSVSLGTSTIAVGIAGSAAKYKAAAVFTAVDTPTMFGNAAAVGASAALTSTVGSSPKGTGVDEAVLLTVAAAALPASGTLIVDLYTSAT